MTRTTWTIRLSRAAEADYDEILRWTAARFSARQSIQYGNLLTATLARLERGPDIAGVRKRDDIAAGLLILHVGKRGRHFIMFRANTEIDKTIDVLRVLHDAMDLARHVREPD